MKLIKNVRFLIQDENTIHENTDICFDKKIKKIGKIENEMIDKCDEIIDGSELIILPGFVNAHTHLPMIILRGYNDDNELHKWLKNIWEIENQLTPEHIYLGSRVGLIEMISSGTLGFVDQYFYVEETIKVVKELGVYSALGTPFISQNLNNRIKEFENVIQKYGDEEKIKIILNPHAIYTCDKECLLEVKRLKEKYESYKLKIHIHAAETRKEVMDCYKEHKMFVIEYLNSLGILEDSILAHCGWIKKDEIKLIKNASAFVVNNPTSNMKLATGAFFPYLELKEKGVDVLLGTDGAASNNCYNMFNEMKIMALLHKQNYWDAKVISAKDALKHAWLGWKIFGIDYRLTENNNANFIAIDTNDVQMMPLRKDNLLSNLVYSFSGKIKYAFVNGEEIFNPKIKQEFTKEAKKLSNEINKLF